MYSQAYVRINGPSVAVRDVGSESVSVGSGWTRQKS